MLNNKKVIAFIGARAGSKGLPDKNIKPFHDKPLIAWTIEAAQQSKYIDEIVVSTDSTEYAEIAKNYGASVIIRPSELADDNASLIDAIKHTLNEYSLQQNNFELVVNLQPTSPLRTSFHIDEAFELYFKNIGINGLRVFSCYKILSKYAWIMRCNEQGFATFVDQQEANKNKHARQDNNEILLPNGAIFILPTLNLTTFYNEQTIPYIMDEACSVDIDSQADFDLALHSLLSN